MTIILLLFAFSAIMLLLKSQRRRSKEDIRAFLRTRARMIHPDESTATFNDVAGVDEAKQELWEIVEALKWPQKFRSLGARIPRGVLLIGPPGTGKTLLARALAGEANVPFFSASGSEFVEFYVGVGASRVRDLFREAKLHAPAIIFIDEIDALGHQRGAGMGSGNEEHEQTLNQILAEMDGFETAENVIVVAATNRPDILDPALIRPGRFDRQVVVDVPDLQGRMAILEVRACGKRLDETADLRRMAHLTPGLTGADLANLLNEAAILAVRRGKPAISMPELEDALDRVIGGPERKSRIIGETEKARLAYHEVGHALIARLLPDIGTVHKLSIIPRSTPAGCARILPRDDRRLQSKTHLVETLVYLLAGIEAERLILGETSTRGARDLEQATHLAHEMVTAYGMSEELGPLALGKAGAVVLLPGGLGRQRNYGRAVAGEIDREIQGLVGQAAGVARIMLSEHREDLVTLAQKLAAEETIEPQTIDEMIGPPLRPVPQAALTLSHDGS